MADTCTPRTSPGVTLIDPPSSDSDSTTEDLTDCPRTFGELCGGTCCDGDRRNNVWIEGGDPETGEGGVCMLDNLNAAQVIDILSRDDVARRDLKRITSLQYLHDLADTIPRLSTQEESDQVMEQASTNMGAPAFYAQFRGQPPHVR